ncbi:MAG: hypothetical protein D6751_04115 [Deltaproteobacteria bacterium]|nr:MAG: hypothetical protein D6751_04115 [Deltaproteobacteria bacterium]
MVIDQATSEILTALEPISAIRTLGPWVGDVDDVFKQPSRLPGLFVIYQGSDFRPAEIVGEAIAPVTMRFFVVLLHKNLRKATDGASEAYDLIEQVRTRLIGLQTSYGRLWPVREELISAESGVLAYGLDYILETEVLP